MKVSVLGSTGIGRGFDQDEALMLGGLSAGICYMPEDYLEHLHGRDELLGRGRNAVLDGHHHVFDHAEVNIVLEDIPKALAVYLNNQQVYTTCEKSGRYTKMAAGSDEAVLYEKWLEKFKCIIAETYPYLSARRVECLAMENARYFISMFTPATTMEYSTSFRQFNYIVNWIQNMLARKPANRFEELVWPWLDELGGKLGEILGMDGFYDVKGRTELKMFAPHVILDGISPDGLVRCGSGFREYYGDVYSTSFMASWVTFASMIRHRTIDYAVCPDLGDDFYVPQILHMYSETLVDEYKSDMRAVIDNFPQGQLVKAYERGTVESFAMKCEERLCGAVQYEAYTLVKHELRKYYNRAETDYARQVLSSVYNAEMRCERGFKCRRPCVWGPERAKLRQV